MIRRGVVGVLVAVVAAASCGGGDDAATPSSVPASDATADSADVPGTVSTPLVAAAPESTDSESTTPSDTAQADTILAVPGAEVITQLTATSGGGARPLLEWEPVDGATEYVVIVFDADAQPYWSTITDRTATHVGGAEALPEGTDGPEIADGYSWAVYADDDSGTPIASSPSRPIAP